jgi:hypothetical protein
MWFLLEEGRFHNVFEGKPAEWPSAKKPIKIYTHNWLCKKVLSLKIDNKIIYNVRKTTREPWVCL